MFEILLTKIAKNLQLKKLAADFIQNFYSTKDNLGHGSRAWEQLVKRIGDMNSTLKERDEEVLNQFTQDLQKSPSVLTAGKFVVFQYTNAKGERKAYFVMIASAFGGRGVYANRNTGNELLTCFIIDSQTNLNTLSILGNVLEEKVDPNVRSYSFLSNVKNTGALFKSNKKRGISKEGLTSLFPKNKFRTFKLNIGMESIYEIDTHG